MQKTILFRALNLLILFAAVLTAGAQPGKVFDNLSMHSDILDMDRKYAVYLPPDYEYSERSYPVLYLLHGAGDNQSGWIQFGEVLQIADRSIGKGEATAMIIVMPNAIPDSAAMSMMYRGNGDMKTFSLRNLFRL